MSSHTEFQLPITFDTALDPSTPDIKTCTSSIKQNNINKICLLVPDEGMKLTFIIL